MTRCEKSLVLNFAWNKGWGWMVSRPLHAWHLFVLPPGIHTDAPLVQWAVLGARDTPGKQSRERPSSTGTHSLVPTFCSPLIKVVLPLGLALQEQTTGQRLRLRQVPFLPSSSRVCSELEQMPGTDGVLGRTVRAAWLTPGAASMESVPGHFSPVGVTVPLCCSEDTGISLLCWTEQD